MAPPPVLDRWERPALRVAAVSAAVAAVVALVDRRAFAAGYLAALMGWSAIPVGCLGVLMMARLIGGIWTVTLRGPLRAGCRMLPFTALLFVPLLVAAPLLYPGFGGGSGGERMSGFKAFYLADWFFVLRTIVYFGIWIALSRLMLAGEPDRRGGGVAAAGLILYAITGALAGVDWMMSLEPSFHSSIFGLMALTHQMLAGLAFAVLVALWPGGPAVRTDGLAALLLSGVLLWAYFAAMQYIIIWSGDLPEEIGWYLRRSSSLWVCVLLAIVLLHGIVPFVTFLLPPARADRRVIGGIALAILVGRFLEGFWLTLPDVRIDGGPLVWLAVVACLAGIGGYWLALWMREWRAESGDGPANGRASPNRSAVAGDAAAGPRSR